MMSIIDAVSKYIGFDAENTLTYGKKACSTYRKYYVEKKGGKGKRAIYHPASVTKSLQYALINILLCKINVHECAHAYIKDLPSPILKNARVHAPFKYTIRIDLKDFFPSIKPQDLLSIIEKNINKISYREGRLTKIESQFITSVLFVQYKKNVFGLAVGSPASPIVSNIVMYDIDKVLSSYASRNGCVYTRYSDDIVFSTNHKHRCERFYNYFDGLLKKTKSPNLQINIEKTIYMSRGTRRIVTGLFITPDGKISIGRDNKRFIRKLIFDFTNKELEHEDILYLRGYLAYIQDVEPTFYDSICIKYGSKTVNEIMSIEI